MTQLNILKKFSYNMMFAPTLKINVKFTQVYRFKSYEIQNDKK